MKIFSKYISLVALLSASFFSSQTVAAECATGTSPVSGCTIGEVNSTYTLTGDIEPDAGENGIEFNSSGVNLNLTGDITVNQARSLLILFNDFNTTTMIGNITVLGGGVAAGIHIQGSSNVITQTGDISTRGTQNTGVYIIGNDNTINLTGDMTSVGELSTSVRLTIGSARNTINMTGNITKSDDNGSAFLLDQGAPLNTINLTGNITTGGSNGFNISSSDSNTINMTGNITTTADGAYGIVLNSSDSNDFTINGNIITSGTNGNSEPILLENSDSNTFFIGKSAFHSYKLL